MLEYLGILIGIALALVFLKRGLYESWAFFINLVISVYFGITLGPILADSVSNNPGEWAISLSIAGIFGACFLILFGLTYLIFISQFEIEFTKIIDYIGGGFFGLLSGLLVWSFISMVLCTAPFTQNEGIRKFISGERKNPEFGTVSTWTGIINSLVSKNESETINQKIVKLIGKVDKAVSSNRKISSTGNGKQVAKNDPNDKLAEEKEEKKEPGIGLPPEVNLEEI